MARDEDWGGAVTRWGSWLYHMGMLQDLMGRGFACLGGLLAWAGDELARSGRWLARSGVSLTRVGGWLALLGGEFARSGGRLARVGAGVDENQSFLKSRWKKFFFFGALAAGSNASGSALVTGISVGMF